MSSHPRRGVIGYHLHRAAAISNNDHDVAHGRMVTGRELDLLEAHDFPLPDSILAAGMAGADLVDLRLAYEGPRA